MEDGPLVEVSDTLTDLEEVVANFRFCQDLPILHDME
jgi:hypothetical protein